MNITLPQLKERVARRYDNVQDIETGVRFERLVPGSNNPYAVCYICIADDLVGLKENLSEFLDDNIGKFYFKGAKSLQWNNYLYLITNQSALGTREGLLAKEYIEGERSYARKIVITDTDIDNVISPPMAMPAVGVMDNDILSVWASKLKQCRAYEAIFSDNNLPYRLSLIEKNFDSHDHVDQSKVAKFSRSSFISKFNILDFGNRKYPHEKEFAFGKVNLFFGVNGAGKTSLLEAIELFYCGLNRRSAVAPSSYSFEAVFANGDKEVADHKRKLQEFRNYNLSWYGQSEVKTNNLYQSFARYNFLDTDAAMRLADSTSNLEDDLSKLLVGPDASRVWRNIEKVSEAIHMRLNELHLRADQLTEEIENIKNWVRSTNAFLSSSDSIRYKLNYSLKSLGWFQEYHDIKESIVDITQVLGQAKAFASQALDIKWVASPVSSNSLSEYCANTDILIKRAQPIIDKLDAAKKENKDLLLQFKNDNDTFELVQYLKYAANAKIVQREKELASVVNTLAQYKKQLIGSESINWAFFNRLEVTSSLRVYQSVIFSDVDANNSGLEKAQANYNEYSKLRNESFNIAQQLHALAVKALVYSEDKNECPICHTKFFEGGLEEHINNVNKNKDDFLGVNLLKEIELYKARQRDLNEAYFNISKLVSICESLNISLETPVSIAVIEIENIKKVVRDLEDRIRVLRAEVLELEEQGYTKVRFEQTAKQLRNMGYSFEEESASSIDNLYTYIINNAFALMYFIDENEAYVHELQLTLSKELDIASVSDENVFYALNKLKERYVATKSVYEKLESLMHIVKWERGGSLTEFIIELDSSLELAGVVQEMVNREQVDQKQLNESVAREKNLTIERQELADKISRFSKVLSVLIDLQSNHSLKKAMNSALLHNRKGIETIFSRIHTPAEFSGLGHELTTLVRKGDKSNASLSEISTGQRAALALSVFLAQNSHIREEAPPVMLIDDPVAHIDDLNSLSFLDYLRDIVLSGKRQLFFATADDKLAALFERKFQFLGEEFKRYNLVRS